MFRKLALAAAGCLLIPQLCVAAPYVTAPPVPQPKAPPDVVGLALQNASAKAIPARLITFGETFAPGQVAQGASLRALIGGRAAVVQADVKNRYRDGSVKFVVLTMASPALAPGARVPVMLQLGGARGGATAVNLPKSLSRSDVTIAIDQGGAVTRIDAARLLQESVADHTASPWLSGPLVTGMRVETRISGSLRLVMDLRAYRNGAVEADIEFDNDIAMRRHGGPVRYAVTIRQAGRLAYVRKDIMQYQYQDWHIIVRSDGRSRINIIHDVAAMERAHFIPFYELKYGASAESLETERHIMSAPGWGAPLSSNGVNRYMPMVGGRWDIGPTTAANAIWLITQSPLAAAYALGQANAAGAVPWHMFDLSTHDFLSLTEYPNLWADGRAAKYASTGGGLTQQMPSPKDCGWQPDTAHQPDLSFIPYLMTGRRYYLDQLNAQASWNEIDEWNAPTDRNNGQGIIVRAQNQLRGAAWGLREIADAAYIDPDGSKMQAYFRQMLANNLDYLVRKIPAWTTEEGQAYGWLPGNYSDSGRTHRAIAPWQEDFFATTMGLIAARGNSEARHVLIWENHFLSGRFLNAKQGFNPHNGIVYALWVYSAKNNMPYRTWQEIQLATTAAKQANGNGWTQSNGYYAETALSALAGVINVSDNAQTWRAYRWLMHSGAPYIDPGSFAMQPQYWIAPLAYSGR